MSATNTATFEMLQALQNGTVPVGKAVSDKNGNDIPATYATKKEMESGLKAKADTSYVDEGLAKKQPAGNYVTEEGLEAAIEDKADRGYVDTELGKKQPAGEYASPTQVDEKIAAAIDAIVNGADGAYDTFKEVAEYIAQDKSGAAAMIQRLAAAEGKITTLENKSVSIPTATVSIAANAWSNKAATVTVAAVLVDSNVWVCPEDTSVATVLSCGIKATGNSAGKVTFSCTTVPSAAVSFKVFVLG